jgi:predicted dehydrogenase
MSIKIEEEKVLKKIKIGVIGLGFVAQNIHLPRILATPEFNLIGVSDQSTERVKNTAQSFNLEGYVDYVKLCERKDVDAVFILTPPHSHHEVAKIAAENKKHIFCEKPLAMNVDQAEQILAETEKAGVKLMVGYMMRFSNNILVLKRMLPLIGEKLNAETVFSTPLPEKRATFHYNKELGGGVLFEMGIHHVNLLKWFFGEGKPVDVKMKMKGDVDVLTIFSLTFQNGVVSQSEVTWANPFFRNAVFVRGENGNPPEIIPAIMEGQHKWREE